MNVAVIIIEALIFAALFTVIVFTAMNKNKETPGGIHNYPPDIQEEYFKTHERIDTTYRSKKVIVTKSFGIVLFTAILAACAYFAGADTFLEGFIAAFSLMVWVGIYDTFFIDWVLFANIKSFRLPGTEHMDKEYHQKWFHVKGMIFPGILFGLIIGALAGLVIMVIC